MKKGCTILFQGDSITDAGRSYEVAVPNAQLGFGYAMLAAAQLTGSYPEKELKIYNRGVSGDHVINLYARWRRDTIALAPDVISILIGINDIWRDFDSNCGIDAARYSKVYRDILEWTKVALPASKLILIEPFAAESEFVTPEWAPLVAERCAIVRQLAADFDTGLVTSSWLDEAKKEAPGSYWLPDGVHPSYAGHQRLLNAWSKVAAGILA